MRYWHNPALARLLAPAMRHWATFLALVIGIPGVAYLVSVPIMFSATDIAILAARILAFGGLSVALIALLVRLCGNVHIKSVIRVADIKVVLCVAIGGTVVILLGASAAYATVLGAAVEELVFRSAAPRLFRVSLEKLISPTYACATAWLVAQVLFATCHFFNLRHVSPFGSNLPFVRLFAAGTFLVLVYEICGFPAAVLLHFLSNELIRTGLGGTVDVPTVAAVAACAVLGVIEIFALATLSVHDARQSEIRHASNRSAGHHHPVGV